LKKDGRTVLLTTHDVDEAERLCERVAIMDGGEIIATGEPRALAAESSAMQSVSLSTKPQIDAHRLTGIPGMVDVVSNGNWVTFRTPDARRTVRELTALLEAGGIELLELHVHRDTLEDVFLRLTGAENDP